MEATDETATEDEPTGKGCEPYLPTPEQIAAECARIRSEWPESRLMKKRQTADAE